MPAIRCPTKPASPPPNGCSRSPAGRRPDDLVLVLLSGGASALACLPGRRPDPCGQAGADRRSAPLGRADRRDQLRPPPLSRIKGGRLASRRAGRLLTLAISDVVGDRRRTIGSGPTVADPTTVADARAILDRYGLAAPLAETPKRVAGRIPHRRGGGRRARGSGARKRSGSATARSCSANARARRARSGRAHARMRARDAPPGTRAHLGRRADRHRHAAPAAAGPISNMRSPPASRSPGSPT